MVESFERKEGGNPNTRQGSACRVPCTHLGQAVTPWGPMAPMFSTLRDVLGDALSITPKPAARIG